MANKKSFQERYQDQETPWEISRPDHNLVDLVSRTQIPTGMAIDMGCGTGDNTIWLAEQGFTTIGCDSSPLAIELAKRKAAETANCSFHTVDFLNDAIPAAPFELAFDRGCFHTIEAGEARRRFVKKVAALLTDHGLWLSLIGNADEEEQEEGPPQLTATEIGAAVEPHFEILALSSGRFDSDMEPPPRCWICLMKKR